MFVEYGMKFKRDFLPFDPFPHTDFLNGEENQKTYLIKEAEHLLSASVPDLNLSDYRQFTATGNRTLFEKRYFDRRKELGTLVLAEKIEGKGRFINTILQYVYSICEEITWCLPAHNTYERDHVQHEYPDASRPVLDLFACETGATLSTALYLLGNTFDAMSPNIRNTIKKNLHERIINPYLSEHFWWMGSDGEPMNNWTIWCTQNILITFYLSDCDSAKRRQAFCKSMKSIDYFLSGYGEDGCCDEGAQYYRHAALCLFQTMNILNEVTDNHFENLYQKIKIQNMASYIHNVHVNDAYYINFSDCSPKAGRAGVREYLSAKACGLECLMSFAAQDAKKEHIDALSDSSAFYDRVQTYLKRNELLSYNEPSSSPQDAYFPSVGLFIARGRNFVLAAKAGDNDDSHNHNDTGSVIIYKNGSPFLIDVGVESYTKKTFSPKRYEIWTMQSGFHNLMTFNGIGQKNGPEFRADQVEYKLQEDLSYIKMELKYAYTDGADVQSYRRHVRLEKKPEERIIIEDQFQFNQINDDTFLSLMTSLPPSYSKKGIQVGDLGEIIIEGSDKIDFEIIPIMDERLLLTWESPLYRIKIYPLGNSIKLILR